MGQSSSVMLDQNIHIITTDNSVKKVSKRAPLIFPFVPEQMYLLMAYWKIWPSVKSRAALRRYTVASQYGDIDGRMKDETHTSAASRQVPEVPALPPRRKTPR